MTSSEATNASRSRSRYRRIVASSLSGLVLRVVSICIQLATVPITLSYLGKERFGILMVTASISMIATFADLGLSKGLVNGIARAHGKDDRRAAELAVSSCFFMHLAIATVLLGIVVVSFPLVDWSETFQVTSDVARGEVGPAFAVLFVCIAISLPFGAVQRVQLGYQEGFRSSLWQVGGALIGFGATLLAVRLGRSLPWLVAAASGGPVAATFLNWLWEFCRRRPWLLPRPSMARWQACKAISRDGILFAWIDLAAFVATFSDNFVISQLFGPSEVAVYSITYKLFAAVFIISLVNEPLWSAAAESLERGDTLWARRLLDRSFVLCIGGGLLIALCFFVGARPLVTLWVGADMRPSWLLLGGFSLWIVVSAFYSPIAAFLSGSLLLKHMVVVFTITAVSGALGKLILAHVIGLPGIIWGCALGYAAYGYWARRYTYRVVLQTALRGRDERVQEGIR